MMVLRRDGSHWEAMFRMSKLALMDIEETATYLTRLGVKVAVPTLRDWRRTWPNGRCKGPRPRLITSRQLRYARADCDRFVEESMNAPCPPLPGA